MFSHRLVYIKRKTLKRTTFYQIQDFGISLSRNDARYQIDNNAPTYRGSDKPANAMVGIGWHGIGVEILLDIAKQYFFTI